MTLIRYRPVGRTLSMQDEMNRMLDTFFRTTPGPVTNGGTWYPASDVRETENEFIVRAELPGVAREDVRINLTNNTLSLRGEKKQETEEKKGNWHHVERTYGRFERTFTLPTDVAADRIKARYQDGVLEIVVPKAEAARPREIPIES
jgi:HSP20 family protein